MTEFRHVLVAVDFDEPSRHAAQLAAEIARKYQARLTVLHVYTLPTHAYAYPTLRDSAVSLAALDESVKGAAEASLEDLVARLRRICETAEAVVRAGVPWREIIAHVEESGADLLVVGTHGRLGVSRMVFGSVAERVIRHARVPVVTAHIPELPN